MGDVRATGLKSFGVLGRPFYGTGTTQDVFQSVGTFFSLRERLKRCLNTPTLGLMSSGPLALFVLILVSFLLTWLVLMVGVVDAGVAGVVGGVVRG